MIFIVLGFYAIFSIYDIWFLYKKNLRKEIYIYFPLISISIIVSSLIALNIDILDPMIYFAKFLEHLESILGGVL